MAKQTVNKTNSVDQKIRTKKFIYCTDSKIVPLITNFEDRKWTRANINELWNLYWTNTSNCSKIFGLKSKIYLQKFQLVNHFPNSYELSRKDLLYRNIKKYSKKYKMDGDKIGTKAHNRYVLVEFLPSTFILPVDYGIFLEEYRKASNSIWIMKPSGRSLGTGIIIVKSLSQIREKMYLNRQNVFETYLISRYIENPMLIGGKKFDLRLYVLVTSFQPLNAFLYEFGFCRFSTETYTKCGQQLHDKFIHLTNVSIQKKSANYNKKHGGKWSLQNLRLYLEGTQNARAVECLFNRIPFIVIHSLNAVSSAIVNIPNCFQLFGYDIIVDAELKPWLIEVNASPSLKGTTEGDEKMKIKLINDTLEVVLSEKWYPTSQEAGESNSKRSNNFKKLDENEINCRVVGGIE